MQHFFKCIHSCHLKLTTPSCDGSAKLSSYAPFGALELGLLRVTRFSCSSGVPFTQGHTKEALGISEAAFGLESAAGMGALELRSAGKVL